jgi:hypothetical protein
MSGIGAAGLGSFLEFRSMEDVEITFSQHLKSYPSTLKKVLRVGNFKVLVEEVQTIAAPRTEPEGLGMRICGIIKAAEGLVDWIEQSAIVPCDCTRWKAIIYGSLAVVIKVSVLLLRGPSI